MQLALFFAFALFMGQAAYADTLNQKIATWERLTKQKDVKNYGELAQFIRKNPDWPKLSSLKTKAEKAMPEGASSAQVIAWFDDYAPKTAKGLDQYIAALMMSGRKNDAQNLIRKWWGEIKLSRDEQRELYRKYGQMINREAHTRRLDTLLFSKQYSNARGIASVLGGGFPALTEARIALASESANANSLLARVPSGLQNDPGLLYERLHWRRENKMNNGAVEILNRAPDASRIQNPKDWWRERHIIIRRLLERKNYRAAYALASNHKQKEGFAYSQAEWISGWLALNFLNKPRDAYNHFRNMYAKVKTPVSRARGAYWAGRAAQEAGDAAISRQSFETAAKFQTVFYGQLAGAKIGAKSALPNAAPPILSASDTQNYERNELIRAAQFFSQQGKKNETSLFLNAFIRANETPKAYRFAAEKAASMGRNYDAVQISKKATAKGLFLTAQSYPVITGQLRGVKDVEWSLIHALIRQESVFDRTAVSHAGARGLMQLMPATASETARKLGILHNRAWLTSRPSHNIKLGSTYLRKMLDRFGGSYPMAIAAYNAGPGRVDKWIKTFGDPRRGEIAWIDWLELMPIYETRNYVQRVLEGTYVYRLRLQGKQPQAKQRIHTDFIE